ISEDDRVKKALENQVELFLDRFYDAEIEHFQLFFNESWKSESELISFGHDIEAVWLIIEAAKASTNISLLKRAEKIAIPVAETFLAEAYVPHKGVINEKDLKNSKIDLDRHWWPQAEAMVGLGYAYRLSGKEKFRSAIYDIWEFTKANIIDRKNGEWFFRIDKNNRPYSQEDKLGMWKCPYHNSRACMLLLKQNL
ncbi:MAG: AGE family epimerase/isomerase, partial [Gillisia sp.]